MGQWWKKKPTRKIKVRIFFSCLAKDKIAAGNMRLGSERLTVGFVFLRFGTSTIEPHLSSAAQNLRRLPLLTDKNISSLRNLLAETERKHFASQKPALVSQWRLAQLRTSPRPGWDPDDVRGFWWRGALAAIQASSWQPLSVFFGVIKGYVGRCAARQAPVKLATFGFVQFQQLSWRESTIDVPKYTNVVESLALFLLFFVCFFLVYCQRLRTQAPKFADMLNFPHFNSIISVQLLLWL